MVFYNEEWNNTGNIVVYSNYHKYWLDRERKIKNPLFDVYSGKIDTGMSMLGKKLANNGRIDKVYYLSRTETIPKLATGGNREIDVHLKTISGIEELSIDRDIILLMDDVTTTGNSLYACKEILIRNGAKHVEMFALGKAI